MFASASSAFSWLRFSLPAFRAAARSRRACDRFARAASRSAAFCFSSARFSCAAVVSSASFARIVSEHGAEDLGRRLGPHTRDEERIFAIVFGDDQESIDDLPEERIELIIRADARGRVGEDDLQWAAPVYYARPLAAESVTLEDPVRAWIAAPRPPLQPHAVEGAPRRSEHFCGAGHTHAAREIRDGERVYLNTGTWSDLMRLPRLADRAAVERFAEDLATNQMKRIQRPTYAEVTAEGPNTHRAHRG